jgi:hypothetical protein
MDHVLAKKPKEEVWVCLRHRNSPLLDHRTHLLQSLERIVSRTWLFVKNSIE